MGFLIAVLFVSSLSVVLAQEEEDAGLLPDSILYRLDKAFERVSLALTFDKVAKAEKRLRIASERLAELKEMVGKGKSEYSDDLTEEYDNNLKEANEIAKTAQLLKEDKSKLTEVIALATSRHLAVLDEVIEKVPDQAKEAIKSAKTASINGHINALRGLSEDKPERAVEIFSQSAEARLNRAKAKAEQRDVQEVKDAVEEFEKLASFGNEISKIAQGLAKDTTTVEQLVARTTSHHLEVLGEIYENVPEQAKAAIEKAMENSAKGREAAVDALKKKGSLGNIPEEIPLPEEVKEKIPSIAEGKTPEDKTPEELEKQDIGKIEETKKPAGKP